MKRIGILFLSSLTYCSFTFGATAAESNQSAAAAVAYGKLPLSFESNQGQADPRVRFTSRGNGYSLALTDSGAVLSLSKPAHLDKSGSAKLAGESTSDIVRMDLVAPMHMPQLAGVGMLPGTANYFIGSDVSKWHTNVPTYSKVRYTGVYPGVDLVYYGNQQQLEYDFVLAPHTDTARVKLRFSGAKKLKIERNGDLTISAKNGSIAFHRPVVYQVRDGQKQLVPARFALLRNKTIGFALAGYDHSRELVIDPTLAYSTYIGGNNADLVNAIAVDAQGNVYLTGQCTSPNFPITSGAFQPTNPSPFQNAFVTKMNAAEDGLVYSTYLGGFIEQQGNAIAVDAQGDAYVAGSTISPNFPTTAGSFQPIKPFTALVSGFVTKLNSTGTGLIYSTYLTGTNGASPAAGVLDQIHSIVLDATGDAYVTGSATSIDFPVTADAFQKTNHAAGLFLVNPVDAVSATNAFVTEFNPSGSGLLYSSYLGGSGNSSFIDGTSNIAGDSGNGIALDLDKNVYVTGSTNSADFPITRDALQKTNQAFANNGSNAFVTKINPLQAKLVYSTYLGGSGLYDGTNPVNIIFSRGEFANAITVDASGRAVIAGAGTSRDFPVTPGAFQSTIHSEGLFVPNAIIAKLNPMGTALEFSTYFGGSGVQALQGQEGETANGVAIDADGSVYIAGTAWSTDMPVTKDAFQAHNNAAGGGSSNAFITKLDPSGSSLQYSTYLGGSGLDTSNFPEPGGDSGLAMAFGSNGDVYVGGVTVSQDYPVSRDAFQKINQEDGTGDASSNGFVSKFSIGGLKAQSTTTTLTASGNPQRAGGKVTFNASVTSSSGSAVPTGSLSVTVNGHFYVKLPLDSTGHATYTSVPLSAGTYSIAVTYSGDKVDIPSHATLVETVKP